MGYQAPSAEEVYRYAFRLNEEKRSLTDRFSWSIVFVNDSSPVCREFLQTYCVELCLRTADRIRFIFFSDMPIQEVQNIAQQMNQLHVPPFKGVLKTILDRIGFQHSRYDFEAEPWRSLRPPALNPLRNVREIERALAWEIDSHTAMPGSGMALQFAQRLGIGRHVPCILVFTDVGALALNLLPIERMSPSEVYAHLRQWIDRFYEANHNSLERWNSVEQQIHNLVSHTETSLRALRDWRDGRATYWRNLLKVSQLIQLLTSQIRIEPKTLKSQWQYEFDLPAEFQVHIVDFTDALQRLEHRVVTAERIGAAAQQVESAMNADEFTAVLTELIVSLFPKMEVRVPKALHDAVRELQARRLPSQVEELRAQLFAWWRHCATRHLPAKRFKKLRDDWIHLAGKEGRVIKEEHAVVLQAVQATPLTADPARHAVIILDTLAAHYGLRGDTQEWRDATERYRVCLEYHLRDVCGAAPAWLLSRGPGMTLGSCLPDSQDVSEAAYLAFLGRLPEVESALEQTSCEREAQGEALFEELRATFRRHQAIVADAIRSLQAHCLPKITERPDLTEEFLSLLQPLRKQLEVQALDSPKASHGLSPLRIDRTAADQLHRTLDEYDRVVESIVFPHRDDPLVRSVQLPTTVLDAVGVQARPGQRSRTNELRDTLGKAFKNEAEGKDLIDEVRKDAVRMNPAGRLWEALDKTVAADRVQLALNRFPGSTGWDKIERLVRDHRTVECLSFLENSELLQLIKALGSKKPLVLPGDTVTRSSLIDEVLCAVGLFAAPYKEDVIASGLPEKIAHDAFDVFMAHNSRDKDTVLGVCRQLRAAGLYPWIDVEQIPPGRWFQDVIQAVIPKVKAAAIFFGEEGLGRWQTLEIRTFVTQCVERNLPLIPVLLPGVKEPPSELLFMRELHVVRFDKGTDNSEAIQRLVWGITGEKTK